MPRPAFGALAKVWSDDPRAAKLINENHALAIALAYRMERVYIGEDVEAAYMDALHDAAFTWRPGKGSFQAWLWMKCRDKNKNLKYRFMRWAATMRRHPPTSIDVHRFYVSDQ